MSVELVCYVKTVYKFYNFFCRRHYLVNQPSYNNLFQIMQQDNIRNFNKVIFAQWKHLCPEFMSFATVIKRHTFHYFLKAVPILGNQSSFWNIAIDWYIALTGFNDIVFSLLYLQCKMNQRVFVLSSFSRNLT